MPRSATSSCEKTRPFNRALKSETRYQQKPCRQRARNGAYGIGTVEERRLARRGLDIAHREAQRKGERGAERCRERQEQPREHPDLRPQDCSEPRGGIPDQLGYPELDAAHGWHRGNRGHARNHDRHPQREERLPHTNRDPRGQRRTESEAKDEQREHGAEGVGRRTDRQRENARPGDLLRKRDESGRDQRGRANGRCVRGRR